MVPSGISASARRLRHAIFSTVVGGHGITMAMHEGIFYRARPFPERAVGMEVCASASCLMNLCRHTWLDPDWSMPAPMDLCPTCWRKLQMADAVDDVGKAAAAVQKIVERNGHLLVPPPGRAL